MKKAYSLIELVLIIVLVGILSLVFASYLREAFSAWEFLSEQKSLALSTRQATNRLIREVRRAQNLTAFSAGAISFVDVDGASITFSQEGTSLMRNSAVLLDNLDDPPNGLVFTYLNQRGQGTSEAASVRLVKCRVSASRDENKFVLESAAYLRQRSLP